MGKSINTELFEALTEAGIKPEAARRIERAMSAGQDSLRAEILEVLAPEADIDGLKGVTKANNRASIAELKADLQKSINDQMWKLVVFALVANAFVEGLIMVSG
jgi:hypothetical protein